MLNRGSVLSSVSRRIADETPNAFANHHPSNPETHYEQRVRTAHNSMATSVFIAGMIPVGFPESENTSRETPTSIIGVDRLRVSATFKTGQMTEAYACA